MLLLLSNSKLIQKECAHSLNLITALSQPSQPPNTATANVGARPGIFILPHMRIPGLRTLQRACSLVTMDFSTAISVRQGTRRPRQLSPATDRLVAMVPQQHQGLWSDSGSQRAIECEKNSQLVDYWSEAGCWLSSCPCCSNGKAAES
jgi:hypothetical protein